MIDEILWTGGRPAQATILCSFSQTVGIDNPSGHPRHGWSPHNPQLPHKIPSVCGWPNSGWWCPDHQNGWKAVCPYRDFPGAGNSFAHKLAIELDDSQRYEPQGMAYDAEWTAILQNLGLQVVRFSNRESIGENGLYTPYRQQRCPYGKSQQSRRRCVWKPSST